MHSSEGLEWLQSLILLGDLRHLAADVEDCEQIARVVAENHDIGRSDRQGHVLVSADGHAHIGGGRAGTSFTPSLIMTTSPGA